MSRKCRNATDRIGGETAILRQQSRHSVRLADHPRTGLTVITRAFWRSDRFSVCVPQSTDALRRYAQLCEFAARPARFWTPAPDKLCSPSKKTYHVALGVGWRSARFRQM